MDSNAVIARASASMAGHGFALVKLEEFWQAHPDKESTYVALATILAFTGLTAAYGILIAHKNHHRWAVRLELLSAGLFFSMVGGFVMDNLHL